MDRTDAQWRRLAPLADAAVGAPTGAGAPARKDSTLPTTHPGLGSEPVGAHPTLPRRPASHRGYVPSNRTTPAARAISRTTASAAASPTWWSNSMKKR